MTVEVMTLRGLGENATVADILREMIGLRLMELEVSGLTRADWGEKSPDPSA